MSSLTPKTYVMALTAEEIEKRLLSVDSLLSKDVIRQSLSNPSADTVPSTQAMVDALSPINSTLNTLGDLSTKDSVSLDSNETSGVLPLNKGGTGGSTLQDAQYNLGILTQTEIQDLINNSIPTIQQVWLDSNQVLGVLPVTKGGTGSNSPAQALKNLGIHDSNGKVPVSQLPAVAITDTFPVSNEAAMLSLTAERGDVAIRTDINKSFILMQEPASNLANWKELLNDAEVKLTPQIRESLRRSYAEAGYTLVSGSFGSGGILTSQTDALLNDADGKVYSWGGTLPKTVPAGSTPASTGGVNASGWLPISDTTLRGGLADGNGADLVGFLMPGAGTISRTVQDILSITVSVKSFGAKGDGITDDTIALDKARFYLYTELTAGNRVKLLWEPGRYIYTNSPNWAINRLCMEFIGEVWLINNGTGSTFVMDGGATGAGVYGCNIKGFPQLYGGAGTQHGAYIRAVHRSQLELECRGAGTAFSGLYQEWNVSNTIQFQMNFNVGGLYNTPARGITQTSRNSNEETSYCTLINPETSGMPVGIYQDGALGNVIIGGASQACTTAGVIQTPNAWNNKFYGTDFEANAADIISNARESQFFGVDCEKSITFQSSAINCSVIGGITENVIIDAGANHTLLSGLVYNRFGLGSITDNATNTRYRDLRDKGQNLVHNKPRSRTPITVGASPFTYTNNSGQDERINISGGNVSQVILSRLAGDLVPTSGVYTLSPGDSVIVTYSVTPSIVRYSC